MPNPPRYPSSYENGVPPGTWIVDNVAVRRELKDTTINQLLSGGANYTAPTVTIVGGPGTGAVFSVTVASGVITGITVVSGGQNYASTPVALTILSPASGSGATANATIAAGVITAVTVTAGGTGYPNTAGAVTAVLSQNTTATATATVVGGKITAIAMTAVGSGFTNLEPQVIITDTTGYGAIAQAFVENGTVPNILIYTPEYPTNVPVGQQDFTNPTNLFLDTVTIIAEATTQLGLLSTALGNLTSAAVGTGAEFTVTVVGGVITNVVVAKGGTGYSGSSATLTFTDETISLTGVAGSGTGAAATVPVANGVIGGTVTISSGGTGYSNGAGDVAVSVSTVDPNAKAYAMNRDAIQLYHLQASLQDVIYWAYKETGNINEIVKTGSLGTSMYPSGQNRGY